MDRQCIRCNGAGEDDSGGATPQGHGINVACECQSSKGVVLMKKNDDDCKCDRPKIRIMHDDLGRAVKYCDKCWLTVDDKTKEQ